MFKLIYIRFLILGATACFVTSFRFAEANVVTRDADSETAVVLLISGMSSWRELINADQERKLSCIDTLDDVSKYSIPVIRRALIRLSQRHADGRRWNAILNSDKGIMVTRYILRVPQHIPALRSKDGILIPSEPIHCFLVDGVSFGSQKTSGRLEYDALFPFDTDPNGRLAISIPKDFPSQTGPLLIDSIAEFDYVNRKYGIRKEPGRVDRGESP